MGALLERRFEFLFVAVVLLLVAYPHAERAVPGEVALPVLRIGVLLAVLYVVGQGRRVSWVGTSS